MKTFQKLPLSLLLLVSASLCRSYGNPDHRQNSVLEARNAPASASRYITRFQRRATDIPSNEPLDDLKDNSDDVDPKPKNKENKDPVEKVEEQIRKYRAQIDKLQTKLAKEEEKLKALKNGTGKSSPKKISKNENPVSLLLENTEATPTTDLSKGSASYDVKATSTSTTFDPNDSKVTPHDSSKIPLKNTPVDLPHAK